MAWSRTPHPFRYKELGEIAGDRQELNKDSLSIARPLMIKKNTVVMVHRNKWLTIIYIYFSGDRICKRFIVGVSKDSRFHLRVIIDQ